MCECGVCVCVCVCFCGIQEAANLVLNILEYIHHVMNFPRLACRALF